MCVNPIMHLSLLYIHIFIYIMHLTLDLNKIFPFFTNQHWIQFFPKNRCIQFFSSSETHSIKPRFTQQLPVPCARPRRAQRTAPIANLFGHDRQTRSASSLPLFPWAFEPPSWQPDVSFSFHVWTSWAPLGPAFAAQRPPKIDSPHRRCVAPAACARNPSQTR